MYRRSHTTMANSINRKDFPFLTPERFKDIVELKTKENYTERRLRNYLTKVNEKERLKFEQPAVRRLRVAIEWHKSRTWGNCPRLEYWCTTNDGDVIYGDGIGASGWGYDKESTVVAEVFNRHCLGMAMRKYKRNKKQQIPYGVRLGRYAYYEGGVGISSYRQIAEWLGGKMEHTACGRTYDEYVFTFKAK